MAKSQFFVKKRLNVSDIIYYKYNPNLKTYRVYVNGKRKWSFGFDNSNYNAMPFIEMLRVYGVKNADENLSLYDISDRRMAKYNRHFLVVIMFEIISLSGTTTGLQRSLLLSMLPSVSSYYHFMLFS